jgi:hypothetical protein
MDIIMKNLLNTKYHLIYAAIAQIIVIGVNIGVLITMKYNIDDTTLYYDIVTLVIPNFFYTAFVVAFYYIYWKNLNSQSSSRVRFNTILFNTLITSNLVYYIVLVLNSGIGLYFFNAVINNINFFFKTQYILFDVTNVITNGLYYIDTTIIQVINAFFASKYILADSEPITTGKEHVVLKVFIYSAVITSLLSFYFCFDNIFMTWAFIVLSAIILFIVYIIYHSHFIRNMQKMYYNDLDDDK